MSSKSPFWRNPFVRDISPEEAFLEMLDGVRAEVPAWQPPHPVEPPKNAPTKSTARIKPEIISSKPCKSSDSYITSSKLDHDPLGFETTPPTYSQNIQ